MNEVKAGGRRAEAVVRRAELARFLRARRERLSPEDVGLPRHTRRRTPGLRREEVALLAGIGAAWYARLEMAHDVRPSVATLMAIARALLLNPVEIEYLFVLAELSMPQLQGFSQTSIPEVIEQLVPGLQNLAAFLWGRYLIPLRWNAIADALFGFSKYPDPYERNTIVRLVCLAHNRELFGEHFEELQRSLVGMFRLAYLADEPTPYGRRIYEIASEYPRFKELWEEHVIANDYFAEAGPHQRSHDAVGPLAITTTNFYIARHHGMVLRIVAPADQATAEKFAQLQAFGKPSTRETLLP
ncbi:MAG TPA: helix-turn-helix domain-containing protein [Candidatus Eremiobacteraceae bacterium]|nr:helix-turn-helix domain-containing protein [Candidatus Eremiobacteraceae bacterium]